MDSDVVAALFAAMSQAQAGTAGMFRVDASSPNGIQGITFLAVDEVAYLQHVEPVLRAAKIEVVKVRGQR
jgi:hypothetical protein